MRIVFPETGARSMVLPATLGHKRGVDAVDSRSDLEREQSGSKMMSPKSLGPFGKNREGLEAQLLMYLLPAEAVLVHERVIFGDGEDRGAEAEGEAIQVGAVVRIVERSPQGGGTAGTRTLPSTVVSLGYSGALTSMIASVKRWEFRRRSSMGSAFMTQGTHVLCRSR